ncbi:MAG: hypothetical protein AAF542_25465 [Pseudomonadota bacterium]
MSPKPAKSHDFVASISLALMTAPLLGYMYLLVVVRHDFSLSLFLGLELLGLIALGLVIKFVLEQHKS